MQMKKDMTAQQAFQRLSALCAKGEHCQQEMVEKMRQWGIGEEEQAQVMARLVEGRYVDDERYARAFVADKVRFARWGRKKIEQALWMKRIGKDIATQVLDEVADEAYVEALRPLIRQRQKGMTADRQKQRMEQAKLVRFALGRGYGYDIIRQCMEVGDEDEFLD